VVARVVERRFPGAAFARFVAEAVLRGQGTGSLDAPGILLRRREPSHAAAASPSQVAVPSSSLNGRFMGPPPSVGLCARFVNAACNAQSVTRAKVPSTLSAPPRSRTG